MLAGSLNEFGLADVFTLLSSTRKTGVLNLETSAVKGRVWIAQGGLCNAVADVTRSPLAARLLHGGEASEAQVREIVAAQADGDSQRLQDALDVLGLGADRVRSILVDQITDAVFDLSRWSDGTFAFDNQDVGDVIAVTSAADVLGTVQQRLAEWEGFSANVPADDAVLDVVSRPSGGVEGISVQAAHWEVLTLVDGLRPVQEIIELTGQGTFTVSRMIADLIGVGLVRVLDQPTGETASQHRRRILVTAEEQLLGATPRSLSSRPVPPTPPPGAPSANGSTPVHAEAPEPVEATDDDRPSPADLLEVAPPGAVEVAFAPESDDTETSTPDGIDVDDLLGQPAEEPKAAPAPSSSASAAEDRRARELAALGIGPAPTSEKPSDDSRPLARDNNVNADLLARLIDGVKGA
ncbi:DUF4388 domain-containing protein [Euzebya rosea]|uniref:DUF4388 domain-containing protein n=1 Tax=Euzebya rosea TaxID=2052804 RepID=UPI0014742579|nr:DUF4388 domain-containing protein [Euzebya rosea]